MPEIVMYPDPRLREVCKPVTDFGPALTGLVKKMKTTLDDNPRSFGLAAPQIGVGLRVFLVNRSTVPDLPIAEVLVNPVVVSSRGRQREKEGCLSLPGLLYRMTRPAEVSVRYQDARGRQRQQDSQRINSQANLPRSRPSGRGPVHRPAVQEGVEGQPRREIKKKPWYKGRGTDKRKEKQ